MGLFDLFKKKVVERPVSYILTPDGNITIVKDGESHAISTAHPNHGRIVAALRAGDMSGLGDLIDVPAAITREFENVTVDEFGNVYHDGNQVGGVISQRIMEFMRAGDDFAPLARFLSNLMENPSRRAIQELYSFLENQGMPITADGCFMAYKGISSDWLDKHSRTCDNSIGQVLEMPRQEVDDDCTQTCSYGYHVGSHSYASSWASSDGRLVLVKVNPRDAVSVPKEHGADKLRVCRYEVMEEAERPEREVAAWRPMEGNVYGSSEPEEDEDYCPSCGEAWCDGECEECEDCGYDEYDCRCEDEDNDPGIDPSTGRARGDGGRFLPRNQ